MKQVTGKEIGTGGEMERAPTVGMAGSNKRDSTPGSRHKPLRVQAKNNARTERRSSLAIIGTCSAGPRNKHMNEDTQLQLLG